MRAEIIAVGTEILLGDIVNTNAQFLSRELANLGIEVYHQLVVGDNEERLKEALRDAFSRSDLVITTGGLGPTKDDLTKEIACSYFEMSLDIHEKSLISLQNYYKRISKQITDNNLKQVYFPKEAIVLDNPNGTAPGAILEKDRKTIIVLPGPPKEMKPMFINHVKPYLVNKSDGVIVSEVVRVFGIGESGAADKLRDIIENQTDPTIAPYAKEEDVIFRITTKAKNYEEGMKKIEPVRELVQDRLGIDAYGVGEDTNLETVVAKLLVDKKLTISTAESCTGGMIVSKLISYPGISECFLEGAVTYSNEAKMRTLNVKKEILESMGAVSTETAEEMARGIAERSGSDIGLATTGIAGPGGGTDEKPVGLVYIGLYYKGKISTFKHIFNGDRENVRRRATLTALDILRRAIL